MKYKETPLKDITAYISKGIVPKYASQNDTNIIRVLNQRCNRNNLISLSNSRFNNLDKRNVPNEKVLKENDVLINSTGVGTAGRVAQVNDLKEKMTVDGHMIIIRPTKTVNPVFYGYAVIANQYKIEQLAEGSTGQTEINRDRLLKDIYIKLPSLDIQNKIANNLRILDNKISLNNQINANLDELMSEIFERYVTEANVFTTDSLSNIANYKNGLAMQRFRPNGADKGLPVLKIKELNQGFTDSSSDRCSSKISNDVIVKTGDIIFSWSGTLIVKIWTGTTCGLNQHLFKVTSDKYPKWFIYKWTEYYLRQFQSIAAGKATTMGHIKRSDLKQAEVKIPHKSEIDRLDKLISPIFKRYVNNILEINSLKELKNELLSKIF